MRAAAAAFVLTCVGLAGCATVASKSLKSSDAAASGNGGVAYFLPQRLVKLTATRKLPDGVQKAVDKLVSASTAKAAAAKTLAEAKAAQKTADDLLKAMDAQPPAKIDAAERARLAGSASRAAAEVKDTSDKADKVEAAYGDASAAVAQAVSDSGDACSYDVKLELQPAQPDPGYRFVARLAHSPLRDDTVKLGVSTSGLLSSANAVAVDRTGDIVVEIAGAIAGLGGGGVRALSEGPPPEGATCGEPRQLIQIFDPASADEIMKANKALGAASYPFGVEVVPPKPATGDTPSTATDAAGAIARGHAGALFYRSPLPVKLLLHRKVAGASGGDEWPVVDAAVVMLPQAGPIGYIPMNSSAFVKTVDDVQFTDGVITSWNTDRPSEVLEVVRLPVKVATAMISVPAQLLSLKVDYSSKAKSLAETQAAEIAMQQKLLKLQTCLSDAKAKGTDPNACLPAGS